jgi:hypothetical protein
MELLGRPAGPWLITALVSAVWVATVALARVRKPLATLALTGLAAGLAVLVVDAFLTPALTGWLARVMLTIRGLLLVSQPVGITFLPIYLAIAGAIIGPFIAARNRRRAEGGVSYALWPRCSAGQACRAAGQLASPCSWAPSLAASVHVSASTLSSACSPPGSSAVHARHGGERQEAR